MLSFLHTVSQYLGSPRPRYLSQYKSGRGGRQTDTQTNKQRQTKTQWDRETVTKRPTKRERGGARERKRQKWREREEGDTERGREKGWDRNLK